jgi:hypothetical protein
MSNTPIEPGYYWAKQIAVDPGTVDEHEFEPSDQWEPVDVFENCLDPADPEYLMVFVSGVEKPQSLGNFTWGARIVSPEERPVWRKGISELPMSALGLSEKPISINNWINEQIEIALTRMETTWMLTEVGKRQMRNEVGEIARGAVLQVIADRATLIDNLVNAVHQQNVRAGRWNDLETGENLHGKRNVGELLALVHSEISEAMEGHRKNLMDDKLPHRPMFRVELIDAIIRIFDILGADNREHPAGAIYVEKLAYNARREDHRPENRKKAGGKAY